MHELSTEDALRYESLKKDATSSVLAFHEAARLSAEQYPRSMRRLVNRTHTSDTPAYLLLDEWSTKVAPDVEVVLAARHTSPLSTAISKHLLMSKIAATDIAKRLVNERITSLNDTFLNHCYGSSGRARAAAAKLLSLPLEDIHTIRGRFVDYHLYSLVARDLGITVYDAHAPFLKRNFQKISERRQINNYKKQQAKLLQTIVGRQEEIEAYHSAIIARILALELDTPAVLRAYEEYKKRLESLKPASRTPKKRLELFEENTKKIRKSLTDKQSSTEKISDLQSALQTIDDVLVELFDMSEAEHETLLAFLKEHKKLERQALRIKKELGEYAN